MDFVKIEIPYTEVLSNSQIQQLAVAAVLGGAAVDGTSNGITTYNKVSNNANTYSMLTYDVIAYIVSLGGNVLNYQSYIKVDLKAVVPAEIRDGGKQTWKEWIHKNNPAIEINGNFYISGYSHYAGFKSSENPEKHLNGIELTALRLAGYTVLNKVEFITLQNSNNEN